MKIVLTDATLEKVMLRYIRDIIKVNSEPIEDGDKLEYFDQDGNLFIRVDRSFPPTVNLLFSYNFYIKMYQLFALTNLICNIYIIVGTDSSSRTPLCI